MGITFTESQMDSIFPFHLEINDQEEIISQGKSLLKIIGDLKNTPFYSHFMIQRPYIENECFDAVLKEKSQFFILKSKAQNLLFKGQVEYFEEKNTLLFILTPWFTSINDLKTNKLLVSDFANFDITFDFLHILKNVEINNQEIKDLVSELKNTNAQLSLQEEKFRNIVKNMNMGLLEVDTNDVVLFANQTFCEMSGYELDELIGKKPSELILNEETRALLHKKQQDRRKGISDGFEIHVKTKNGEDRIWFISGAPQINDKGECIGSIGAHLDITDQKKLENELANARDIAEQASKSKEHFLANMSHEIRTPLNIVIGMIRLIEKESISKQISSYIFQSKNAANHLLSILNDILDMSKIENGEMKIVNQPIHFHSLVESIKTIFSQGAEEKGLCFTFELDEQIFDYLLGDELRIRQILINVIGNALKFTENGSIFGKISVIEDTKDYQRLHFIVKDTGIGMSHNFVENIFDKFTQEFDSANRKFEGTGLGMSITKDLLLLMDSQMHIQSQKGSGTIVHFDIKFQKTNISIPLSDGFSMDPGSLFGGKILLVEDNKINRLIAGKSIESFGCTYDEAENGEKAVELLKINRYDLILMDIQMPIMDGVEATRIIRNNLAIETPIVALTANAFKHDLDHYREVGMNDFIIKPFEEEDFFFKISKNIIFPGQ
jgi:PAS domain S-box-containing protein